MHKVTTKTILSTKNHMNIYTGCLHGCIYCDSRSKYYKLNHDFEDVEVKENAVELLDYTLSRRKEKCMIATGSKSDPYNPLEAELCLTQKCLEVIYKRGFGASILTKSDLILRDLELIKKLNERTKCVVMMTLTCADDKLSKIVEPNVCPTSRRLEVLKIMKENNIPTVVWITPLLPYINDTEDNIYKLLKMVNEVGAKGIIYYGPGLTLREGSREYYYKMLDKHFPILRRRYQREFKNKPDVSISSNIARFDYIIKDYCEKHDIMYELDDVFYYINNFDTKLEQLSLFEEETE